MAQLFIKKFKFGVNIGLFRFLGFPEKKQMKKFEIQNEKFQKRRCAYFSQKMMRRFFLKPISIFFQVSLFKAIFLDQKYKIQNSEKNPV